MKYVQQVRGKWVVRMVVPEELRGIIGQRELVEIGLPNEARAREKRATAVINSFHAKLDEAREVWESLGEVSKPTLSSAAKEHYRTELLRDDLARAAAPDATTKSFLAFSRSVYANRLRLLVADKLDAEEAEALIGYAADALRRDGRSPDVPRKTPLRILAEIQLEALETFEERDGGQVKAPEPVHPLLTEPDPVPKTMPGVNRLKAGGVTVTEALAAFHKERTAGGGTLAPRTMEEHRNAARMFNEFMEGHTPLRVISRKHVTDYKRLCWKRPPATHCVSPA